MKDGQDEVWEWNKNQLGGYGKDLFFKHLAYLKVVLY